MASPIKCPVKQAAGKAHFRDKGFKAPLTSMTKDPQTVEKAANVKACGKK